MNLTTGGKWACVFMLIGTFAAIWGQWLLFAACLLCAIIWGGYVSDNYDEE